MADITRRFFLRHLRSAPTAHVRHLSRGRIAHEGTGSAFWFRPLTAALSEIPVDDREQPLLFHARTIDFQDITVQATVAYRFAEPALAAERIDFSIDVDHGLWRGSPLEQVGGLLTELSQQHALALLAQMPLPQALSEGMSAVRERMATGLGSDERLSEIGLRIVDVRVIAVRAEPDVERALQTPMRELVQQDADKATFERRAMAVEHERGIAENELQNQIELARREEQLVMQKGQNERSRATEQAAAERIAGEAAADAERLRAEVMAGSLRLAGAAEGEAETARMSAYAEVDQSTLVALALRELAGNLPEIGTLNLTPDLLAMLAGQLMGTRKEEASQ